MAQIISKYIQLQGVSKTQHGSSTDGKRKSSSNNDCFYHSPFQIKGTENEASLQEVFFTKLISLLYRGMSHKETKQS